MAAAAAAGAAVSLEELEAKVQDLGARVFDEAVKEAVAGLLKSLPSPDDEPDAAGKARRLMLHARTLLLLPTASKEAEALLNKALKLNQGHPSTWVALSEAYWRRNATREARDALDAALKADPGYQPALVQYSRILRAMSAAAPGAAPELSHDEKHALLHDAVAKGKAAVAADPRDGVAWAAYGVALLQDAVAHGMELAALHKVNAALTHAVTKCPLNPDAHFNRGVVGSTLGFFGVAAADFARAYTLDRRGLHGARGNAEAALAVLRQFKAKGHTRAGLNERDFAKNVVAKLPPPGRVGTQQYTLLGAVANTPAASGDAPAAGGPPAAWVGLKVLDLMSRPTAQPLVYLVVDRAGTFAALLVYRIRATAIKPFDTVTLPFPHTKATTVRHVVPALEFEAPGAAAGPAATEPIEVDVLTLVPPTSGIVVNNEPIGQKHYVAPQLATMLF